VFYILRSGIYSEMYRLKLYTPKSDCKNVFSLGKRIVIISNFSFHKSLIIYRDITDISNQIWSQELFICNSDNLYRSKSFPYFKNYYGLNKTPTHAINVSKREIR